MRFLTALLFVPRSPAAGKIILRWQCFYLVQTPRFGHRAKHFPQQLSGGQQQRVAIARAVVAGPGLILADEPTGNLDSRNGIDVMNLLSELNQEGATILMVTHSDRDARFAHKTIKLLDGQIVT